MAASRRFSHPSLIARLGAEPGRFRFFQAVRLLERQRAWQRRRAAADDGAAVGEEADPRQRIVRFRAGMRLSFPAAEVDDVSDEAPAPPAMTVSFMGLTGPSSVLPQHYSVALWREFRNHNTALRDFFDLFNDRLIAFFYRAWTKYRIPISVERSPVRGQDGASEALRALIGFGTEHLAGRAGIAEHALLHYAGVLSHFPRNAASLADLLCDYFKLPIRVVPFDGRWLSLPREQRTSISASDRIPGSFCRLSRDAVVGESYWDVESNFTIEIGPIDYAAFASLMPNGETLRRLASLTRLYINPELGIRVELCLRRDDVPLVQLDADAVTQSLLGWNTWLRHDPMSHDPRDASYRL
jgi:type VI secretion system protein ImpH